MGTKAIDFAFGSENRKAGGKKNAKSSRADFYVRLCRKHFQTESQTMGNRKNYLVARKYFLGV